MLHHVYTYIIKYVCTLKNVVYYNFNLHIGHSMQRCRARQEAQKQIVKVGPRLCYVDSRTTEPSMEVLQLDRKSTSRLSCFTIPPTAMELTSRIAESSRPFSPPRFSTSDVSDEVIIFRDSWTTP